MKSDPTCAFIAVLICVPLAFGQDTPDTEISPQLVTPRSLERTGFQEASPYKPTYDLRTDFVMSYGLGRNMPERLRRWTKAGYVPQVMTGIAWGDYQDYLGGKVDNREHWDEGQVDAAGKPIDHGPTVPYMVPAVSFSDYLEDGLRRVIDAGAVAIHLEEPEFWARAGFSEAFKREWRIFYNETWQRPDASCDAQYRASKLKYYLYQRALDRVCSSMKEYALTQQQRTIRFYVPTHSLLNYTQWRIVSPQSSLIDLPGIDGYIAQVWTGTSRTANVYQGRTAERTFETAYLEYGVMQELVRGTGQRMWFLNDPIEDNPRYDWDDYQRNYFGTLVASLLQPNVWHYEVAPWPRRVFEGRYPRGKPDAKTIPSAYATVLNIIFNQLRDMKQEQVKWPDSTKGVGVFLADSAMFQRAEPAFREGTVDDGCPLTHATAQEVRMLSGFYGLALPPLKHGIPIRPVQLDNVARFPSYLDDYKVLLLSYEFLKPLQPGIHLALAQWVQQGGSLIYIGADTDPFKQVREWWNRPPRVYAAPSGHLFETLGLARDVASGEYPCGKGMVIVQRIHPASISRSSQNARRFMQCLKTAVQHANETYIERNSLHLRRGPYVLAACLSESVSADPLTISGRFINLLDPNLSVLTDPQFAPGQQAWFLDLNEIKGKPPLALAAAGRIETWKTTKSRLTYTITSPADIRVVTRILLPAPPKKTTVDGKPAKTIWDRPSRTVLVEHAGRPDPIAVEVAW